MHALYLLFFEKERKSVGGFSGLEDVFAATKGKAVLHSESQSVPSKYHISPFEHSTLPPNNHNPQNTPSRASFFKTPESKVGVHL